MILTKGEPFSQYFPVQPDELHAHVQFVSRFTHFASFWHWCLTQQSEREKVGTIVGIIGTLSKPRERQQRGHGKTKDLIGRSIAQHVHFKTLYISQLSQAKQQREFNTVCVVCERKPRRQIILIPIQNSTLLLYVMLKLRFGAV